MTELQALFNSFIVGRAHTVAVDVAELDSVSRFGADIFVLLRSQHRKKDRYGGHVISALSKAGFPPSSLIL